MVAGERKSSGWAQIKPSSALLDLGTGTGDLARKALKQNPKAHITAADFTLEMMRAGRRPGDPPYSAADALNLPFDDAAFDAIVSGFLMRNVTDVSGALKEQQRALKPGGKDRDPGHHPSEENLLTPFIWIHMHIIISTARKVDLRYRRCLSILPDSTEGFLYAEELAERMTAAGFKNVHFKRLMFGVIAIHWERGSYDESTH